MPKHAAGHRKYLSPVSSLDRGRDSTIRRFAWLSSLAPPDAGGSIEIPEPVCQLIETERRRLQKASAVLGCLVYSATHNAAGINYDDVARVALDLVVRAVNALDIVRLRREAERERSIQ